MTYKPPISLYLETNVGGFPVTICACGVLLAHGLANIHIMDCEVFHELQRDESDE